MIQHGVVPIPSSATPAHVHANADVFGFRLTADEVERVNGLHRADARRA
jgi:alcohol dehydrogenase (NADP+)